MIGNKMVKFILKFFFIFILLSKNALSNEDFNKWNKDIEIKAINSGISKKVVTDIMSGAQYLPKVIEYDRYQPEFYEDTFTYIKKRSSKRKVKEGLKLFKKKKLLKL